MVSFPLIRVRWSNEHLMTGVFIVLLFYLLPQWVENPLTILGFLLVLLISLVVDLIANLIRYKRPICGVSAAVTAAMLEVLTTGIPLWGKILGILVALIGGKHLWGGSGKNVTNPAITGVLFLSFFFPLNFPPLQASVLLIPAFLLSIPFTKFRPYAASGLIIGMLSSLLLKQGLTLANLNAYGVFFWASLVMTDPVTITPHPLSGLLISFLVGFVPVYYFDSTMAILIAILIANLFSLLINRLIAEPAIKADLSFQKQQRMFASNVKQIVLDLTGEEVEQLAQEGNFSQDEILQQIKDNNVFGFGGAAFPTYNKLKTVMDSLAEKKHLIVNGVECDPGLIHDKWLLAKKATEIYQGIQLLNTCIDFDSITIAAQELDNLEYPPDIKLFKVANFYPWGAEKILIKEIFNKEISHQTITAKTGILVLNVQTVFAIYQAVYLNQRADSKYLTVANLPAKTAKIVRAKLGTKIFQIVQQIYPSFEVVFSGGGLMQAQMATEEAIIDPTVNFLAIGDIPRYKESVICSHCGFCEIYCPARLRVSKIAQLVDAGKLSQVEKMSAERCLECGSCSFICLAGRNLSARLKKAKRFLAGDN